MYESPTKVVVVYRRSLNRHLQFLVVKNVYRHPGKLRERVWQKILFACTTWDKIMNKIRPISSFVWVCLIAEDSLDLCFQCMLLNSYFFQSDQIVSCVIDPLIHSVTESASHLPSVDMAVYLLNCLYNMQSTLAMYEYMDDRMERLQAQSDAQIDTLTSEQASSLVANLNLGPIYTILQSTTTKLDLNQLKMFMVSC